MDHDLSHIKTEKLERKKLKKLRKQQARDAGGQKPMDNIQRIAKVNGITAESLSSPIAGTKPKKEKKRKQQVGTASAEGLVQPVQKRKKKRNKRELHSEATGDVVDASRGPNRQKDLTSGKTAAQLGCCLAPAAVVVAAADSLMPQAEKKKKSKAGVAAPRAAQWAAVGSQELARAGAPVQKALYAEDPAVTGMTEAAVQQWREERDTVVTGCDIKPVTAFGQAGWYLAYCTPAVQAHLYGCILPQGCLSAIVAEEAYTPGLACSAAQSSIHGPMALQGFHRSCCSP